MKFELQSYNFPYAFYKHYEIINKIGKGAYGEVYKIQRKTTKETYALKIIIDAFQNVTDAKRTYRELNYLFQLEHPCIVSLKEVINMNNFKKQGISKIYTQRSKEGTIENHEDGGNQTEKNTNLPWISNKAKQTSQKHVYALFEFVETDLQIALEKKLNFQIIHRKYIAFQLLNAVLYLHNSGLIHRDIKPSNILINLQSIDIKLCDFGMCRRQVERKDEKDKKKVEDQSEMKHIITEYVAARWYRPPEVLLGISSCDQSLDMWSIGCLMAELIMRVPLFPGNSTLDQLERVIRCIGMPSSEVISKLPSLESQYLLKNFPFNKRLHSKSLSQFLQNGDPDQIELISEMLHFTPNQRISAKSALQHKYFKEIHHLGYNLSQYQQKTSIQQCTTTKEVYGEVFLEKEPNKLKYSASKLKHPQQDKLTLENYRFLIQQLTKNTSRTTNRSFQRNINQKNQCMSSAQEKIESKHEEKSTRESNFLDHHKKKIIQSNSINNKKIVNSQKQRINSSCLDQYSKNNISIGFVFQQKSKEICDKNSSHHTIKSTGLIQVKKQTNLVRKYQSKKSISTIPKKKEKGEKVIQQKQIKKQSKSSGKPKKQLCQKQVKISKNYDSNPLQLKNVFAKNKNSILKHSLHYNQPSIHHENQPSIHHKDHQSIHHENQPSIHHKDHQSILSAGSEKSLKSRTQSISSTALIKNQTKKLLNNSSSLWNPNHKKTLLPNELSQKYLKNKDSHGAAGKSQLIKCKSNKNPFNNNKVCRVDK